MSTLRPLYVMFFIFMVAMFFVQFLLCWRSVRAVRRLRLRRRWSVLLSGGICAFFAAMAAPSGLQAVGVSVFALLPAAIGEPYRTLFLVWMVSSSLSFLILLTSDTLGWVARHARAGRRPAGQHLAAAPSRAPLAGNPSRRQFLQVMSFGAAALPIGLTTYGAVWGRSRLEVVRRNIVIDKLPAALDGLTVGQMSDIHAGTFMSWREINDYALLLQEMKPDLIALTGDFVTRKQYQLTTCLDALQVLQAPLGIFACLGNHEFWAGIDQRMAGEFAQGGVHLLVNESVHVERHGGRLAVLGIADAWTGRIDWQSTLAGVAPETPKLLLAHIPDVFPTAGRYGIDLTLSGHYHGGQLKLPSGRVGLTPAMLVSKYIAGHYRLEGARRGPQLYVNRGLGTTGVPVRLNARPEITLLTLRAQPA